MIDIRSGRCPLCDHREVLEAIPAEFGDGSRELAAAVTYDARWMLPGRNPGYPRGPLKLYVCRGCGFTQHFADDPAAIPVGPEHKTRLIAGPAPEPPYR
jgi:hypothetical protein